MHQRRGIDSRLEEQLENGCCSGPASASTPTSSSSRLVSDSSTREATPAVSLDCEMVGAGVRGCRDLVARVSIVNCFGHVLYDQYVQPPEKVTDYRTFVSGIYPHHLESGLRFGRVQQEVSSLLKGRLLVGHAVTNDLRVLHLEHPRRDIRDTCKFFSAAEYGGHGTPSLKKLTEHHVGVSIQSSSHDSVEDARAAMRLYTLFQKEWEARAGKPREP